jgi:AcrR family transcriptional regulator
MTAKPFAMNTGSKSKVAGISQGPARRSQGRPAGPATADIRQAILDSAESLFARKGYAATSLREIASEVNVNPAMVNYYFGGKRVLLQQVLESTLEPLAEAIAGMRSQGQAPVSEIVRLLLRTFSELPNLPYLVVREVMLPGGEMHDFFLANLAPRLGGSLPELLARQQTDGRIKQDLDPRICALMLLSLCAFPFIAREIAEPGLNVSYDENGMQDLEQHITGLLMEGISA